MPEVSVLVPSYNHGCFLRFAIDSALDQSHEDLELVLFDDGSTDGSYEIALEYAATDSRVRVLTHANRKNHGIGLTVAAAAQAARGEYVCLLPADDTLFPDSIVRRVIALRANTDASFAYGLIEMLAEDGAATGQVVGTPLDMVSTVYATGDPLEAAILHNYMPGHSVLVRRSALAAVGGYDSRLLYGDWHTAIKLHAHGRATFVASPPVAGHRLHAGSMSLGAPPALDVQRRLAVFRALDADADAVGGRLREPSIRGLVSCERAYYAFAAGYEEESRSAILSALALDPKLATNVSAILWWLTPHQQAGRASWIIDAFAQGQSVAAVIAEGARRRHFACWIASAVSSVMAADTAERLRWALIANELEGSSHTPSPAAVRACIGHIVDDPRLLRERTVLKAVIASAGLWELAVNLRARFGRRVSAKRHSKSA